MKNYSYSEIMEFLVPSKSVNSFVVGEEEEKLKDELTKYLRKCSLDQLKILNKVFGYKQPTSQDEKVSEFVSELVKSVHIEGGEEAEYVQVDGGKQEKDNLIKTIISISSLDELKKMKVFMEYLEEKGLLVQSSNLLNDLSPDLEKA